MSLVRQSKLGNSAGAGNFLQLEGPLDKACEACKQMALSATLQAGHFFGSGSSFACHFHHALQQDLAGVARRAAELGLEDIAEATLCPSANGAATASFKKHLLQLT